jgi:DNA-binding CsgD family transcriptional regulator
VFANTHALAYEPFVDNLLPPPIYEWFMPLLQTANAFETPPIFQSFRADIEFLIKINPCEKDNEYLLMLEKHSGEWDLDTVRSAFGLTFRETEILMWISRGKTNKEIGVILGSSARTVSKHLENIFGKLGVASRAAAVSTVLQRQS